ncbi:unnamed protein product [Cochlearia groenlandica]
MLHETWFIVLETLYILSCGTELHGKVSATKRKTVGGFDGGTMDTARTSGEVRIDEVVTSRENYGTTYSMDRRNTLKLVTCKCAGFKS